MRKLTIVSTLLLCSSAASASLTPEQAAESYRLNCAPCHGINGRMDPSHPNFATFESPPADLSDAMFNSMEPSGDWFMVTKYGGKPLGLSPQMPAYDGALSDAEIAAIVAHLKTLADTEGYPPGDLNLLRPIRTIKAFPETEALLIHRLGDLEDGTTDHKSTLYYGHRFGKRWQGEIKASRVDRPGLDDASELELGFKWAAFDDLDRRLLVTAGAEAEIQLDSDDGPTVYIPYVSLAHVPAQAWTLQSTLRAHLPSNGADNGDVELSAITHWMHSPWPRRPFPALEMVWTEPFEGETELSFLPQVFTALNRRGHVALTVGVEIPATGLDFDYRIHAFLLWDIADGKFWEGW